MQKKSVLFVLLFLGLSSLFSLTNNKFGLKCGLNLSNFSTSGSKYNYGSEFNLLYGPFWEASISSRFYVQQEFFYSKKGSSTDYYIDDAYGRHSFQIHEALYYLQMPILFKTKVNEHLAVFTGPSLAILCTGKRGIGRTYQASGSLEIEYLGSEVQDISEMFTSTDFSIIMGIEYFKKWLVLDLRYEFGLTNLSDTNSYEIEEGSTNEIELYNRTFSVLLGYKL